MINNRQAGRRRGRGGNGGSNGQRPGGNPGRPDSGNRIDNRARGNANQLYEKYKNLARDAHQQGDRVNTEYYLQFADHYFRVLSETRNRSEDGQQQQRRPRDFVNGFDNDFDGDDEYGDEGEPLRAGEQGGDEPRRDDTRRDEVRREEVRRDEPRRDEPRREEYRRDEPRREARRDAPRRDGRDGRESRDGQGEDQQRRSGPAVERGEAAQAVPVDQGVPERAVAERVAPERVAAPEIANDLDTAEAPVEPRRRGRPRRERPVEDPTAVIEADRLPPALSAGNDSGVAPAEEAKPRRRRRTPQGEAPAA